MGKKRKKMRYNVGDIVQVEMLKERGEVLEVRQIRDRRAYLVRTSKRTSQYMSNHLAPVHELEALVEGANEEVRKPARPLRHDPDRELDPYAPRKEPCAVCSQAFERTPMCSYVSLHKDCLLLLAAEALGVSDS